MDIVRFERLTRSMVLSRRTLTSVLSLGMFGLPGWVEAKKKRRKRKKHKKITFNDFGCVHVGARCKQNDQCCSGLCGGKQGSKTCRAHGTGTCEQNVPGICTAENPAAITCNSAPYCYCYATTAGSNFCFDGTRPDLGFCAPCAMDADCVALGWPPGSACAPVSAGECAGACESGMACLAPCGFAAPASG